MGKTFAAIAAFLLIILSSCDMFVSPDSPKSDIYIVAIGLRYLPLHGGNVLDNTENDIGGFVSQVVKLADMGGYDYRAVVYDDFSSTEDKADFKFTSFGSDAATEEKSFEYWGNLEGEEFAEAFLDELTSTLTDGGRHVPGSDDLILLLFSGHGEENGIGPVVYYEKVYSLDYPNLDSYSLGCLGYDKIERFFLDRFDSRAVAMYDCCYSGWAIGESELGDTRSYKETYTAFGQRDDRLAYPDIPKILGNALDATFDTGKIDRKRYYIAAAHDTQTSFDSDRNSTKPNQTEFGAFSYQMLSFLGYDMRNMEARTPTEFEKKVVSVTDLFSYVDSNMSRTNRLYATPNITGTRYDMALFDFR